MYFYFLPHAENPAESVIIASVSLPSYFLNIDHEVFVLSCAALYNVAPPYISDSPSRKFCKGF